MSPSPPVPVQVPATAPDSAAAQLYMAEAAQHTEQAHALFAALEAVPPGAPAAVVIEAMEALGIALDAGMNRAGLLRAVSPDERVRELASQTEQALAKIGTNLGLSRPTFAALQQLPHQSEPKAQRLIDHGLRDLRRAGVDRPPAVQQEIRALHEELVGIGQAFEKNIREDVRRIRLPNAQALAGLPADYVANHPPGADGQIEISTDYPDYIPFMSYADDDAARRQLFVAFRQRGYPKNEAVLHSMLKKRHQLANRLGYTDWASYVTEDKMIRSKQAAQAFVDRVHGLTTERAQRDLEELRAELQRLQPAAAADSLQVQDWQKTYLEERVKRQRYSYDAQKARQFFPFGRVQQGLFDVVSEMFSVSIRPIDVPVWHPSVKGFALIEGRDAPPDAPPIGKFYLDLHPRPDKYKHAAAFPLVSGVKGRQLPVAALVCNFPEGDTALLEHNDVQTFFHEFGHLLHHLFAGQQTYVAHSGIRTEWDFVEAPSQMLEEWTYDAATLSRFAKKSDGTPIDPALIEAMRKARDFGKGIWAQQQMFYAALSLHLHAGDPHTRTTDEVAQQMQARYAAFPYVPETHFQLSFGHLEGYSAIYYTYMWSLVIAKDLFSKFAAAGLLHPPTAAAYRRCVLAPGGSENAADLVQNFLGRPTSFDAFAAWLRE
jgi:thimet oligopeptidase